MKTNNMFDKLDREAEIDINTVYAETGVKTENVVELFREKASVKASKPARKTGRVFVILAAATAAALALGAVTVTAKPAVDEAFAEYFAGNSIEGVYSGSNVKAASDKVNVEFLGVAGDDRTALSLVRFSAKDGSRLCSDLGEGTFFRYKLGSEKNEGFYARRSAWITDVFKNNDTGAVAEDFTLKDDGTVILSMRYTTADSTPKGDTIEAGCDTITAVHPVKTVYTLSEDEIVYYADRNIISDGSDELYKTLNEKYGSELKDGQELCISKDGRNIVIADVRDIALDFTLSAKLDYKTCESVDLKTGKSESLSVSGADWRITELTARSYSMTLKARSWDASAVVKESASGQAEEPDVFSELDVTLKNGRKLKARICDIGNQGGSSTDGTYCEVAREYSYYEGNGTVIIDPAQISSVIAEGTVIF